MTQEDMKILANMLDEMIDKKFDEKLKPIYDRPDKIEEDVDELNYKMEINNSTVNSLSEWAEAVTKYYFRDLHYPLHDEEKLT